MCRCRRAARGGPKMGPKKMPDLVLELQNGPKSCQIGRPGRKMDAEGLKLDWRKSQLGAWSAKFLPGGQYPEPVCAGTGVGGRWSPRACWTRGSKATVLTAQTHENRLFYCMNHDFAKNKENRPAGHTRTEHGARPDTPGRNMKALPAKPGRAQGPI